MEGWLILGELELLLRVSPGSSASQSSAPHDVQAGDDAEIREPSELLPDWHVAVQKKDGLSTLLRSPVAFLQVGSAPPSLPPSRVVFSGP